MTTFLDFEESDNESAVIVLKRQQFFIKLRSQQKK